MNPTATTYCGDIIKNMGYDTASDAWERDKGFFLRAFVEIRATRGFIKLT